jgi:hypothetical protein
MLTNEIDLFEHWEQLPTEAQEIIDRYSEEGQTYENCANMLKEFNAIGYTFEYGLDAEPYNLQLIK